MTTFHIKLIAIITMIIDHVGLFFFPDVILLRIIGRLAFPLFAWLIANGAYYSRNIKKYEARLLLFAFISQIPFVLANRQINHSFWSLNVIFTLFIGLVVIELIKKTADKRIWIIIIAACAGIASILNTDYGAAGVLSIVAFYIFFNDFKKIVFSQSLIFFSFYSLPVVYEIYRQLPSSGNVLINMVALVEPAGLLSLAFIWFYNRKEGIRAKYLFYIFYPLQYAVIYLLLKY